MCLKLLKTKSMTKKFENVVDVFPRNLLRKILNIGWPKTISNTKLYQITTVENWSRTIKRRSLNWYGHLLRLPDETSAKAALKEARSYAPKPRGGQRLTWLKLIDKDLENIMVVVKTEGGGYYRYDMNNHEKIPNIMQEIKKKNSNILE